MSGLSWDELEVVLDLAATRHLSLQQLQIGGTGYDGMLTVTMMTFGAATHPCPPRTGPLHEDVIRCIDNRALKKLFIVEVASDLSRSGRLKTCPSKPLLRA